MIARMQIRETAWSQLLFDWQTCGQDPDNCTVPNEIQTILNNGQVVEIKDAQNPVGFILLDVIASETDIDTLYNYFSSSDRQSIWKWNFNGKVDFETEYTGQHNDILATQPDHVERDQDGNETGRTPASFEDPNWVHGWKGQEQNRFARAHNRSFGESHE